MAQAHNMRVTASMTGSMVRKNCRLLSVSMRVDPALVVMAAAPMINPQHRRNVIRFDVEIEDAVGEQRYVNRVESETHPHSM